MDNASCTLVNAINSANSNSAIGGCTAGGGFDTIVLQNSHVHSYTAGTFPGDGNAKALPSITSTITIQGNGSTIERDSGSGTEFRLLHVENSGDLTLDSVTLTGGAGQDDGSDPFSVSLSSHGGAILNRGAVTLSNSTVTGNWANYSGGGLHNSNCSTVTLTNSTVSGNTAAYGGGLSNEGCSATLINSTVSGNLAIQGGGLHSSGSVVTLSNSTVSDNSASSNGGLDNRQSTVTLTNSTVSNNRANPNRGGGLGNIASTVTLSNSIIANNPAGNDCNGDAIIDAANNWFGDTSCTGTATQGTLNLGPLADNGGSTHTHALMADSGAIDQGDNAVCAASPVNGKDQRGISRPQGTQCDIGAYEFEDTIFFVVQIKNGKSMIFGL